MNMIVSGGGEGGEGRVWENSITLQKPFDKNVLGTAGCVLWTRGHADKIRSPHVSTPPPGNKKIEVGKTCPGNTLQSG
jgi:hypothetical protein